MNSLDAIPSRCGFIGILGPTNAGKSTLLNAIIGEKISIVSPKVQTTYHTIRGILTSSNVQLVFVDTPGLQKNQVRMARILNDVAEKAAIDCDVLIWVFDVTAKGLLTQVDATRSLISRLKLAQQSICVLNKVDQFRKLELLPIIQQIHTGGSFSRIIPLSARRKEGVSQLIELIKQAVPEGPHLFPEGQSTDRTLDYRISEIVREKIFRQTYQELPYSVWTEVEHFEADSGAKTPVVRVVIHVDSDSKKGILIGKQGERLKEVGVHARQEIEKIMGRQICLKLHIDVQEGWKDDARVVSRVLELSL